MLIGDNTGRQSVENPHARSFSQLLAPVGKGVVRAVAPVGKGVVRVVAPVPLLDDCSNDVLYVIIDIIIVINRNITVIFFKYIQTLIFFIIDTVLES